MMMELSFHLVEPTLYCTTLSAVAAPGVATVQLQNLGYPVNACYDGAELVIDSGLSEEIVTVSGFNAASTPPTITATFALPHAAGVQAVGATFPTQAQSGDYFFSQTEILSYIARAQNQFLSDVPMIFALNTQTVTVGQVIQPVVCDMIEIARIASSYQNVALVSLSRLNNVVTATSVSPHGLIPGEKFAIFQSPDPNFDGAFNVGMVTGPTTWTYPQVGLNELISGGGWVGLWLRLLEVSQEELSMQSPFWQAQFITKISSWWEDRAGIYRFGVNGKPSTNLPVSVLCAIRDTDVLLLTDGLLVPDPFLHYTKYKALEYCYSKDGEQRDSSRAAYCKARYDRGVAISRRWLGWAADMGKQQQMQMATAGGRSRR
jgi:hypothetical protein